MMMDTMIKDTIAIIPARKNSKRLKNKNILEFFGKPLITHTIKNSLKSFYIKETVVSTDSRLIKKIALKSGAKVPYLRPKRLSKDNSKSIDLIKYEFAKYIYKKKWVKQIILLQPTSPLRNVKDINLSIKFFKNKKADFVTSLYETKPSSWYYNISKNKKIKLKKIPSKKTKKNFLLNGAIYIYDVNLFKKSIFKIKKPYAFIMPKSRSVDVDDKYDFELAKIYKKNYKI